MSESDELKKLQKEYKSVFEDLRELQKEFKHVQLTLEKTQNVTLLDNLLSKRKSSGKILSLPTTSKEKLSFKDKVIIYENFTGITINNISMQFHPVYEGKKIVDTSWLRYLINAKINQIGFQISYLTDQKIENVQCDECIFNNIRDLKFLMNKTIHQTELQDCLEYFSENPNRIALAFIALRDYNKLFLERRFLSKTILEENPHLISKELVIEEKEVVYMHIIGKSNKKSRKSQIYIDIKWSIQWESENLAVRDVFLIDIPYKSMYIKVYKGSAKSLFFTLFYY